MKTTVELSEDQARALARLSETCDVSAEEVVREALARYLRDQNGDVGSAWAAGISREWHEELSDPREDIYAMTDGEPVDESG